MTSLRRIAQQIRHQPGLERAEWLWSALRRPYHKLLDLRGAGVDIAVGGIANVRMPTEFVGGAWEQFEPASVAAYWRWLREHPRGIVLDIGCSIGIYSLVALFAADRVSVVAFDSDPASLRAARRMTKYASGDRLRLVLGFVASDATECGPLADAVVTTAGLIEEAAPHPDATRFVCIGDPAAAALPRRRLDDLFPSGFDGRACLIKCDVEGAEQLVLTTATAKTDCADFSRNRATKRRRSRWTMRSIGGAARPCDRHARPSVSTRTPVNGSRQGAAAAAFNPIAVRWTCGFSPIMPAWRGRGGRA